METNVNTNEFRNGRLPANAPLANVYVPFQSQDAPRYEARKGLVRGTLFPGLDLPFHEMTNQKEKPVTPLSELQVLGFAIQELALYLDTHADDNDAFEVYQSYQKLYAHCKEKYLQNHGPINHIQISDKKHYAWLNDPWPWEYSKNKEGG